MLKADLTELERVKIENYTLRVLYMQQQIEQIKTERANFIHQLEAQHPGCEWDEQRGLVQREELEGVLT